MVKHQSVVNLAIANQRTLSLSPSDKVLQFANLVFDASVWEIFPALLSGATLVCVSKATILNTLLLARYCRHHGATVMVCPPEYVQTLSPSDFPTVRYLVSGGSILPSSTAHAWQHAGKHVVNAYGPTETTVCATMWTATSAIPSTIPIGKPIANTHAVVLDTHGQLCPIGVKGTLHIGGIGVAGGYVNHPQLTAERFVPRSILNGPETVFYDTGDIVSWTDHGNLLFHGRQDNQVKYQGYRLELGEIEHALIQHPAIALAAVVLEDTLCGFYTINNGHDLSSEMLLSWLPDHLPHYMIPRHLVPLPHMPMTISGKIDRNQLKQHQQQHMTCHQSRPVADWQPANPIEQAVYDAWVVALNRQTFSKIDNFFALGGDSLGVITVTSAIEKQLGLALPAQYLYTHPTFSGYVQTIGSMNSSSIEAVKNDYLEDANWDKMALPQCIGSSRPYDQQPAHVLVTGSTGFVGKYLVAHLASLDHVRQIHCLVRAPSIQAGQAKLARLLRPLGVSLGKIHDKVHVVLGDLAQPRLDIADDTYAWLSQYIDTIYHGGAMVNFIAPYTELKSANVEGTRDILHLAMAHQPKILHYLSTLSVFESTDYTSHDHITETSQPLPHHIVGGYAQSKWVAEWLVQEAIRKGLPGRVFRLGRITGHTHTNDHNPDDLFVRFVHGIIQLGAVPNLDVSLDLMPVDVAVRAIARLTTTPMSSSTGSSTVASATAQQRGPCFHIHNPQWLTVADMTTIMANLGIAVASIPYAEWVASISSSNPLFPLKSLFQQTWAHGLTLPELYAQSHRPAFNNALTMAALDTYNVPSSKELFRQYIQHIQQPNQPLPQKTNSSTTQPNIC